MPKITALPDGTALALTGAELLAAVQSGTTYKITAQQILSILAVALPQGRLTLTTGVDVTTSDVTGVTTLYYTPSTGRRVPIYNGTQFVNTDIGGELSNISTNSSVGKAGPAAVANSSNYDLYVWNDSGTIRLTRSPAWSSDTSRGTGAGTAEIERILGIWVNKVAITNGPAANRGTLVGSARSSGSAQWRDTFAFRHVSNIYNPALRPMRVLESTDTWNYTTATFRPANGNTANALDWLHSLDGVMVDVSALSNCHNDTTGTSVLTAIGIDSTSARAVGCKNAFVSEPNGAAFIPLQLIASWKGFPGIGRHTATWLEYSGAAGTTQWYGDLGLTVSQSGIDGWTLN